MKKIILSLSIIAAAAAVVIGVTTSFFSDTETSSGNTFTAGALDLKVDNTQHYNNAVCVDGLWQLEPGAVPLVPQWPVIGSPCDGTWAPADLGAQKFFNFTDIKPGDSGEDTISLEVDNDACLQLVIDNLDDFDNTCTEPEDEALGELCTVAVPELQAAGLGELQENLLFSMWLDQGVTAGFQGTDAGECDNILQGEPVIISEGPIDPNGETWNLYDYQQAYLLADQKACFGVSWRVPEEVGNIIQTDSFVGDMTFNVVQKRHNETCQFPDQEEEELPQVGANLSLYQAPTTCDVTVDDNGGNLALDTIPEGIAAATADQTVCVAPGTYPDQVVIDKSLILASTGGPANTFVDDGIIIDADNVTVKGFLVSSGSLEGTTAGFYIKPGVDNLTIRDNHIDGPLANDPTNTRGIINVSGGAYSNILIENNEIHEWTTGIYTNPVAAGTPFHIKWNDIDDNLAGIGGITGSLVELNEFQNIVAASEAIGSDASYDLSVIVNNNFLNGTRINDYALGGADIIAENNFFNISGVNQTTPAEVDFTPETGSQYPHN